MSAYNIFVNDVQKSKNKVLCLVRINNYRNMLNRVSVGESIKTERIQMNFHDSIGKSSWTLIFYPKGQYIGSSDSSVRESGCASIYLQMINCENQNDSLATVIKVFIKSPHCDFLDEFVTTKFGKLSFRNVNERWIGPFNLADTDELYSKRCNNLFSKDSLTIGCELTDTTPRLSIQRSMVWSNANPDTTHPSYSATARAHLKHSKIFGSDSNHATSPKNCPCLQPKGIRRSEGSFNWDETKGSVQKKVESGRRSSYAYRKDVMKENEIICRCLQPDQKVSRETQTWGERLSSTCNRDFKSKEVETGKVFQSSHGIGFCVKDVVEFFEKCSIPRN